MKRRMRTIGIVSVLATLPLVLLVWWVHGQYRQQQRNHALIAAIKAQRRTCVLELLDAGADANAYDIEQAPSVAQMLRRLFESFGRHASPTEASSHLSALNLACTGDMHPDLQDEEIVLALLDHGANTNGVAVPNGNVISSLECVFWSHQHRALRRLIECGADVNAVDQMGCTLLMTACIIDDLESVTCLLQHGANPNVKDTEGNTALSLTSVTMNEALHPQARKIVALLKQHGATK